MRSGSESDDHVHPPGQNGGIIVSVGQDHYHTEVLFEIGGVIRFYMLGQDQEQVMAVPVQEIAAYARAPGQLESISIVLKAQPQAGDPTGQTSMFVGKLPDGLAGSPLVVTVPSIQIAGQRYRFSFTTVAQEHGPAMPAKVTSELERDLYLTPGGKYTAADISANGSQTASQKYASFVSAHDLHPKPGDRICPITKTKANSACSWVIDGQKYEFCCPPCIDEFVKRAKADPDSIEKATDYLQLAP